jgi:hypothetical protein
VTLPTLLSAIVEALRSARATEEILAAAQGTSPYMFVTEAGTPVTTAWFLRMVQRTGRAAGLAFGVHPHVLRHSTGYKLANDGQDTSRTTLGIGICNRRPGIQRWRRIVFGVSGGTSRRPPRYVKPECQHSGSRAVEPTLPHPSETKA